ncbi:hypothetical protein ACJMK2_032312 [Sinanodonta woodiana]|uniref:Sodium/glucose cotransporter 4 n=1 Tax=Sinanodonta woodiana TaxID=1069815 RepID=A0ABD3X1H0_SINWO
MQSTVDDVSMMVLCNSTFRQNRTSTEGYFLAGKNMTWFPVGASIFASNVGAPMYIGLAGTAAASGFAVAIYEWHAVYLLIALGWVFVPVYVASGAYTMPEYLKKRFGGRRIRIYLSVLALILYILTKISAEIYSGAIFMKQLLNWNMYACILIILAVTCIYTVAGGLTAVIYTDTIQTIILLIGAFVLMILGFHKVGGWNAMIAKYPYAAANYTLANTSVHACGLPREDFQRIFRDPKTGDIPWTGAIFGLSTIGIWVWCTDQLMVQRCLSAKNLTHAKAGSLMAAVLKILPFFLWIIPGMISRILFPDEIACADPVKCEEVCGNRAGCTNIAYPLFVLRMLPGGLRGLMLSALLAALMSSLTSIFNSASTMFTMDIWRRIRPHSKQRELMLVGRISGAFWGLMAGLATGLSRMVVDFMFPAPVCGSNDPDNRPAVLKEVHFLHFAIIISGVCALVTTVVSLFTKSRPPEKIRRLTFWTRNDPKEPDISDSEVDDDSEDENIQTVEGIPPIQSQKSIPKRMYHWLCGISDKPRPKLTEDEKVLIRKKMTSISEKPFWKSLMNVLAIIVAIGTTFMLGFFN